MNTNTNTSKVADVEAAALSAAAVKRGRAITDRMSGRSVKSLAEDLKDCKLLAAEVVASGLSANKYAAEIDRSQTDVSRAVRAAEVTAADVKRYMAAGKRVVSVSGLLSFLKGEELGDAVAPSAVERAVRDIAKLDSAADLDAVIKAAQARKREIAKAAKV